LDAQLQSRLSFEKDIPDLRLDAVLSGTSMIMRELSGLSGRGRLNECQNLLFSVAGGGFNLLKNFRVWFTVNEELGDASSLRTSVSGRLTYLLR